MTNIESQANELITFAQLLAKKLDTNCAFDQCYNSMTIEPLVRHKVSVECEKNITHFGLLDENAVSGVAVQDAVKDYIGEEIMEMVPSVYETLQMLTGYANRMDDDYKKLNDIMSESSLPEIMSPTSEYDRPLSSLWTVYRHLREACEYLTRENKWCSTTDMVREEYRKDLRRKFKRSKFFIKNDTGELLLKEDALEQLFGDSHPVLRQFAGTEVQVTGVRALRDCDGDYVVYVSFRDGTRFQLSIECTLTDVANMLVERVLSHYECTLSTATEQAAKGMPVTASWTKGSDEHKLAILKCMNFECPEALQYQVFWKAKGNEWDAYQTLPAGTKEEGIEPICKPTTYTLATELAAAKVEQRKVDDKLGYAERRVTQISRELLEVKEKLSSLHLKKFDSQTDVDKAINDIEQDIIAADKK